MDALFEGPSLQAPDDGSLMDRGVLADLVAAACESLVGAGWGQATPGPPGKQGNGAALSTSPAAAHGMKVKRAAPRSAIACMPTHS